VIHHESTTGRLNDLQALAAVCRERGVRLLVDGVSSIAAVAPTANKCLHGVPGASFVVVRREALLQAASRTYYLDFERLAKLQDQRNTPFTPSIRAYYALVEVLRELADAGGWTASRALCGARRTGARGSGPARYRERAAAAAVVGGVAGLPLARRYPLRATARCAEGARLRG